MIYSKKDLKEVLTVEKKFYNINIFTKICTFLKIYERGIIWSFQKKLRKCEYHLNSNHKFRYCLYLFALKKFRIKYGICIPPNCFDSGLHIMHLGSILINKYSRIGKNCVIHINTALVSTSGNDLCPKLGDNVKIGIGSIIVGGITIPDGVAIGAGSIVVKDVIEKNITVAGVPAKKISNNNKI